MTAHMSETSLDAVGQLEQFLQQGGTLQVKQGLDSQDLELVYAYAYQLSRQQDWAAARRYFLLLTRCNHWNFDYWFALGLANQNCQDHAEAVYSFAQAAQLRLTDPRPAYFSGESLLLLGHSQQADKAWLAAEAWCGLHAKYHDLKMVVQQRRQALHAEAETRGEGGVS